MTISRNWMFGLVGAFAGLMGIAEWLGGKPLAEVIPFELPPISPASAFASIALGGAVLLAQGENHPLRRRMAIGLSLSLFLWEPFAIASSLGWGGWFLPGGSPVGSCLLFLLLASALAFRLLAPSNPSANHAAGSIGAAVSLAGALILVGYWYHVPLLSPEQNLFPSLLSALSLSCLGAAVAAIGGPAAVPVIYFVGQTPGARISRWTVLAIGVFIFALGFLHSSRYTGDMVNDPLDLVFETFLAALMLSVVVMRIIRIVTAESERSRKELEATRDELKQSVEKYTSLFTNAAVGMFRMRIDGMATLEVNDYIVKMSGFTREEWVGKPVTFLCADPAKREKLLKELSATGRVKDFDVELRTKGGDLRQCIISFHQFPEQGYMEGSILDITDRRTAERAAQENEEKFRLIVTNSPDMTMLHDRNGAILYISPQAHQVIGHAPERFIGASFPEYIHPADRERVFEAFQAAVGGRDIVDLEYRFFGDRGEEHWLSHTARPLVTGGKLTALYSSVRSITERKREERTAHEQQERLRIIAANTPDHIVVHDRNLRYTYVVNPQLGMKTEEMIGKTDFEILPREEAERLAATKMRVMSTRRPEYLEAALPSKEGKTEYFSGTLVPTIDAQGAVDGLIGYFRNVTAQREADNSLKQAEEKFRRLFSEMSNGCALHEVIVDHSGRAVDYVTLEANLAYEIHTTIKRELVIGRKASEAIRPEEFAMTLEAFAPVALTGVSKPFELFFPSVDKWFSGTAFCPGPNRFALVFSDVTSSKRSETLTASRLHLAEFAMKHSLDELLEETLNEAERMTGSSIGFYHFVEKDQINLSLQNWSTRTKAEFCRAEGKGLHYPINQAGVWVDCVHQRRPVIHNDYASLPNKRGMPPGHAAVSRELVVPILRGEIVRAILGVGNRPVNYNEQDVGMVAGLADIAWEIAERKLAEDALRESETSLKESQRAAHVGHWAWDTQTNRVTWSDEMRRMFGLDLDGSQHDFLQIIHGMIHPDDRDRISATQEAMRQGAPVSQFEYRIVRADGIIRILNGIPGTTETNADGVVTRVTGIVQDITERKHLEAQLYQSQRLEAIGTLSSGIAHDFNNILNIIIGNADLLDSAPPSPEGTRSHIDAIITSAERGAHLVKQLLAFARKTAIDRRMINANDTVREIARLIEETFPKSIAVRLNIDRLLPEIEADPNQLHQVLLNLCVNARDAMPGGGLLTIETCLVRPSLLRSRLPEAGDVDYVCLKVGDTGSGIAEKDLKEIFNPFFTTKDIGKGTGLGLSVVYGIVRGHEGIVDVSSTVGQGTEFCVYLPVTSSHAAPDRLEVTVSKPVPGGNELILFVDDEPLTRELAKIFLEKSGYSVILAANGEQAVGFYQAQTDRVAIVLCDYGLPQQDGEEVFRTISAINPGTPFVLMTGFIEPNKEKALREIGIREIIHKPFKPEDVLRCVRGILDSGRPHGGGGA
jgi:two-component system, cell cycle sensor histidine kinase and response regulator CckA